MLFEKKQTKTKFDLFKKKIMKGIIFSNTGVMCILHLSIIKQNSWQLTFVVESMLNILSKHRFFNFVKVPAKLSFLPLLKITK